MDLTYIETGEDWRDLAGILDCFSRRLVGWSMPDHMRTELVGSQYSALILRLARPGSTSR